MKLALHTFAMMLMLGSLCAAQELDELPLSDEPGASVPVTDSSDDGFAQPATFDTFDSEPDQGDRKQRKPAKSRPEPVTKAGQPVKSEKHRLTVTLVKSEHKATPQRRSAVQPMQAVSQVWYIHCDEVSVDVLFDAPVDVQNEDGEAQYSFTIGSPLELKTLSGSIVAESLNYSNGSFELTNAVVSMGGVEMFADSLELDAVVNSVSVGPYQRQRSMPPLNFNPNSFDRQMPYEPGAVSSPSASFPSTPLPNNGLEPPNRSRSNDDFRPRRIPETSKPISEPLKPQPRQPKPADRDDDFGL